MSGALFISTHDFRSLRKASIHFIAAEMASRGTTRFFSVGLSWLSERRGDVRANLSASANKVETTDGVDCYLWRNTWHPFNLRKPALSVLESIMFKAYRRMMPDVLRRWIREAEIVLVESGLAAVFIADIRRLNPAARIIYLASDDLDTIDCAKTIKRDFIENFDLIDTVRLPSRYLLSGMPHGRSSILVPHGIDRSIATPRYDDPYSGAVACVSVGSMLFDPHFFEVAAPAFPDIAFHIIGAGKVADSLHADNIFIHPEMAFVRTLPFLQHAAFGVAPYRDSQAPRYLIDTSLKLRQFGLFGTPAVCPEFVRGDTPGRFGYRPGDDASIRAAIRGALGNREPFSVDVLDWHETVERILTPEAFADVQI